jgi:hypothetical protein
LLKKTSILSGVQELLNLTLRKSFKIVIELHFREVKEAEPAGSRSNGVVMTIKNLSG